MAVVAHMAEPHKVVRRKDMILRQVGEGMVLEAQVQVHTVAVQQLYIEEDQV